MYSCFLLRLRTSHLVELLIVGKVVFAGKELLSFEPVFMNRKEDTF